MELKTVALLCLRIEWMGQKENRKNLMSELYVHTLAGHAFALQRGGFSYEPGRFARMLAPYPVTFRACLAFCAERDKSGSGLMQLDMVGHYMLRQYGLSVMENETWLNGLSAFVTPCDLPSLASKLQKDALMEIAGKCGLEVMKSWKKERLVDVVAGSTAAAPLILARAPKEFMQIRPDLADDFAIWIEDLASLGGVASRLA